MNIHEPGQDRNVAALSNLFMCGGFSNMDKTIKYMNMAYKQALKAKAIDEVPVGCVIVKDDKVIAKAHNQREKKNLTTGHAEILAINKANKILGSWRLEGCDIYVTLEPCIMCAGALLNCRIKNIYFGAFDPKGGALGSSINILESKNINHHPAVYGGIMIDKCSSLLKQYFKEKRNKTWLL